MKAPKPKRVRWDAAHWQALLDAGQSTVAECWDSPRALESCPDGVFDLVATDEPYSSGGLYVAARTKATRAKYVNDESHERYTDFAGDQRDQVSWTRWCRWWLSESLRVSKPGGVLVVFSDWRQLGALILAVQEAGWTFRGVVPWDKTEGGARPLEGWFRVGQCEYLVTATHGDREPQPGVWLPGVVRCTVEGRDERLHIAQKPLKLCDAVVEVCPRGGRVLDLFAGSGSVIVSAKRKGRFGLGLERVAENVRSANERLDGAREQGDERQQTLGGVA